MKTEPNTDLAVEFLRNWKPDGPWILTAIGVDRKFIETRTFTGEQEGELRKWLDHSGSAQRNIYYHVNTCMRPLDKKADKVDVRTVDVLHVDVDPEPGQDFKAEQKRILKLLQDAKNLPKPDVIVYSGGGYQAFWRLREPIEINGDLHKAQEAERYNLQIELVLNGDSCHNVDRIMRLPGTINWPNERKRKKGQQPAMADVVRADWDARHGLDEFTPAPIVGDDVNSGGQVQVHVSGNVKRISHDDLDSDQFKNVDSRAKVAIVHGFDDEQPLKGDNSRSGWLRYVCCELVRGGVDDETIYGIITDPDLRISDSVLDKGNSKAVHRYAVRQIQRAKESAIEPWLEKLNSEYAVIEAIGGKFRIAREMYDPAHERQEIEFCLPDGFKMTYSNAFIEIPVQGPKGTSIKYEPVGKWWLSHPHRRTYRKITFYPNHDFGETLNLWRGFAYDAIPGDCDLFLHHILHVLCKGNRRYYDYLIGWMANAVQNPHLPGQVAVVLRGEQGTGKGTFAHHFGRLFGTHYKKTSNPEHIVGQFNIMLMDAALVFADECFASGNAKHEAALKELITEPKIRVTPKGVDSMEVRNCVHLIMATNATWAVSAALDDRRFFVLEMDTAKKVDTEYFGRLNEQMENGGYQALLHYLLTYDLSSFDVRNCPKTEELRHQQEQSLKPVEAFWLARLEEGTLQSWHRGWTGQVYKDQFADCYVDETGDKRDANRIKMSLGKWLTINAKSEKRRLTGNTHSWKNARGREVTNTDPWVWIFPSLKECRRIWDEKFGPRNWPEVPDQQPDENPDETDAF